MTTPLDKWGHRCTDGAGMAINRGEACSWCEATEPAQLAPAAEPKDERAAFEAAWLAHLQSAEPAMDRYKADEGWVQRADLHAQDDRLTYCERRTRDAYAGWQAARALAAAPQPAEPLRLPEPRELPPRDAYGFDSTYFRGLGWNECLDEVRRLAAPAATGSIERQFNGEPWPDAPAADCSRESGHSFQCIYCAATVDKP